MAKFVSGYQCGNCRARPCGSDLPPCRGGIPTKTLRTPSGHPTVAGYPKASGLHTPRSKNARGHGRWSSYSRWTAGWRVWVRPTHLDGPLISGDSVRDEPHAHHGEQAPCANVKCHTTCPAISEQRGKPDHETTSQSHRRHSPGCRRQRGRTTRSPYGD